MDEFLSEREQLDALRRWWRENGSWIIGGLVVGLAVLFGWRAWNEHQAGQAEAASRIYGELLTAMEAGDRTQAASLRRSLTEEYGRTPYADLSGLALAKLHVAAGDPQAAAEALQDVLANTDDEELAHIARLRLARVHLQQEAPEAAEQALAGVDEDRFAPLYAEVRGDISAAEGDLAAARAAYLQALESGEEGVVDRNLVQMKLHALGGAAAAVDRDAGPAPAEGSAPAPVEGTTPPLGEPEPGEPGSAGPSQADEAERAEGGEAAPATDPAADEATR